MERFSKTPPVGGSAESSSTGDGSRCPPGRRPANRKLKTLRPATDASLPITARRPHGCHVARPVGDEGAAEPASRGLDDRCSPRQPAGPRRTTRDAQGAHPDRRPDRRSTRASGSRRSVSSNARLVPDNARHGTRLGRAARSRALQRGQGRRTPTTARPARPGRTLNRASTSTPHGSSWNGPRRLWTTTVYLGLRPGEAAGLSWTDVDLAGGVVHVRRAPQARFTRRIVIGDTKTAWSVRSLDAPHAVVSALRTHRKVQAKQRGSVPVVATTLRRKRARDEWSRSVMNGMRGRFRKLTRSRRLVASHTSSTSRADDELVVAVIAGSGGSLCVVGEAVGHDRLFRHDITRSRCDSTNSADRGRIPPGCCGATLCGQRRCDRARAKIAAHQDASVCGVRRVGRDALVAPKASAKHRGTRGSSPLECLRCGSRHVAVGSSEKTDGGSRRQGDGDGSGDQSRGAVAT